MYNKNIHYVSISRYILLIFRFFFRMFFQNVFSLCITRSNSFSENFRLAGFAGFQDTKKQHSWTHQLNTTQAFKKSCRSFSDVELSKKILLIHQLFTLLPTKKSLNNEICSKFV